MQKEYAFEAFDIFGARVYWAASYPTKAMVINAAKEYVSNYPGRTAKVRENKNTTGDYRMPVWIDVAVIN